MANNVHVCWRKAHYKYTPTHSLGVTISLEQSAYSVSESQGMVEVCANVTQGMLAPGHSVSVQLSTVEGTAGRCSRRHILNHLNVFSLSAEDLDYSSVNSSLSFSASTTRQCVDITILADGLVEPDELFSVNLTPLSPAVILGTSMATVTITDSDSKSIMLLLIMRLIWYTTPSLFFRSDHLSGTVCLLCE